MSARANPTAIGAFVLGAAALLIGGIAVLATGSWFEQRETFVSYFPESINGLEVGAPVKFQGVPVGVVTSMEIQIDLANDKARVPVIYDIQLQRLLTVRGTYVNLADDRVRAAQIADGLRVQLQMESFVTGQLYLELQYADNAPPAELAGGLSEYPELPTTPSLMASLGTRAGGVVTEVVQVVRRINGLLGDIDMAEINSAVIATARSVQSLAESPDIRRALRGLPAATAQVTRTMQAVEQLAVRADSAVGPLSVQAERATTELADALRALRQTLEQAEGLLSTDSGIGFELQGALSSIREAADALQLLTTTIEHNPDVLLRGKKPPEPQP